MQSKDQKISPFRFNPLKLSWPVALDLQQRNHADRLLLSYARRLRRLDRIYFRMVAQEKSQPFKGGLEVSILFEAGVWGLNIAWNLSCRCICVYNIFTHIIYTVIYAGFFFMDFKRQIHRHFWRSLSALPILTLMIPDGANCMGFVRIYGTVWRQPPSSTQKATHCATLIWINTFEVFRCACQMTSNGDFVGQGHSK